MIAPAASLRRLRTALRGVALGLSLLVPGLAAAAESAPAMTPRVTATLIADRDAVVPGERFRMALVQRLAPGWHSYWRNPGDSGEPTRIDWELPPGVTAGPLQWPAPEAIPFPPLVNFGFKDEVVLPVEISVPAALRPGETLRIRAKASWLVCETICIPEEGSFALSLPVESASVVDEAAATRIAAAEAALPRPAGFTAALAATGEDGLSLTLPGLPDGARDVFFFPHADTLIDHSAPQLLNGGTLALKRSDAFKLDGAEQEGVLTFTQDGTRRALLLAATAEPALLAAGPPARAPAVATLPPPPAETLTLWIALGFAFAGGLILNLMPCVLPVLFIKALGFAQMAQASRATLRLHGLLFLAGVIATFLALAGLVVALGAGWGFQLQSPPLVIGLAVLMVLIGLNLLGAFEVGGRIQGLGGSVATGNSPAGALLTGALAVVVATPCTAPFMGAAMGYAVTQPPALALAVFLALALGFAAPVVALSFAPGLLRLLPRPGPWMLVLKQAFAFPMFATAIWLIWVATVQAGAGGALAALVAILVAGFAVWLLGVTRARGRGLRLSALALGLVLAFGAGAFVLDTAVPAPAAGARGGSEAWTPQRVAELQAQGKPVFVNFTAAWCITCLANERVALSRQEVKNAFARLGVVYLKADWTNRDATIAAALGEHGRAGVPLYLAYPGRAGAPAEILPQLLTADTVVAAAERAAEGRTAQAGR